MRNSLKHLLLIGMAIFIFASAVIAQPRVAALNALPPGAEMTIISGNPDNAGPFVIRLKLPAKYQIHAIFVSHDEQITVLEGILQLGLGNQLDPSQATLLLKGQSMTIPAKKPHFALTDQGAIIQVAGTGPWDITYLRKEYDPREK